MPHTGDVFNLLNNINVELFLWINQYAGNSGLLDFFVITTAELLPYLFIATLIYLWLSSDLNSKQSALNAGFSVLLAMLFSYIIALFYVHPRPFMEGLGTTLIEHAPDSSFPSDHTTFMFAIAIRLLFESSTRAMGLVLCFVALIGGLARVYSGVHFPMDILAAIMVATVGSVVIYAFNKKLCTVNDYLIATVKLHRGK